MTNPGRRIESLVSRMAPHQTPFSAERGCSGLEVGFIRREAAAHNDGTPTYLYYSAGQERSGRI